MVSYLALSSLGLGPAKPQRLYEVGRARRAELAVL